MSRPLFTVVIPTIGRETLVRTLKSIRTQAGASLVEIVVVADLFEMDEQTVDAIRDACEDFEARYTGCDDGRHDTGSPQLALGYATATGQWIVNLGDDDVYEPMAFSVMRQAIEGDVTTRPLMFRTVLHPAPHRGNDLPIVLWHRPEFERGEVSGQCFAVPNVPEKLGRWTDDVTFMMETVERWGGLVGWRTEVVSQCY